MTTQDLYAQDGVNIEEGDSFSQMAGAVCRDSFENSPFAEVDDFSDGHFRGPRGLKLRNLPDDWRLDIAPDGIGTKVVVIDAAMAHRSASRNLVAMCGGDITRWGGKPLVFVNVLDVSTLGNHDSATNKAFRSMIQGLGAVARAQQFVCFRGETAELGDCVGSDNPNAVAKFNWAGFMLGVYLPDRMITGKTLAPGQTVVALEEDGFRSNGFSSVRAALRKQLGDAWTDAIDHRDLIRELARPAVLYDRFLADANGWTNPVSTPRFRFHLVTHVTGGGIVEKFGGDVLARHGLSAILTDLFEPPECMKQIVAWRGTPERECYRTFTCGNGALVVLDEKEVSSFIAMAQRYGILAKPCGKIVRWKEAPTLRITSGFSGKILTYTW